LLQQQSEQLIILAYCGTESVHFLFQVRYVVVPLVFVCEEVADELFCFGGVIGTDDLMLLSCSLENVLH
jgi:hypothetical protein